jgi:hypothetical protein
MNNTSAFPTGIITDGKGKIIGGSNGMNLRDYFAAKALPWFLNKLDEEDIVDDRDLLRQFAADHAYKMADAMMKARAE